MRTAFIVVAIAAYWQLLAFSQVSGQDFSDDSEQLSLRVEHSLDEGLSFEPRGTLSVHSLRSGSTSFAAAQGLDDVVERLRDLCSRRALYLLRAWESSGLPHQTVMDPCAALDASLRETFTIHLDWRNNVVGVSVAALASPKAATNGTVKATSELLAGFKTKVLLQTMESGPQPDTASFVQKMEADKLAKQRGEVKDNRSFLAKYWMYIVPVLLLLMISGGGQEGGGAAR